MGRPVPRIHSRASALDHFRDQIAKSARYRFDWPERHSAQKNRMKILALELSTIRGSLAWLKDGVDLFVREWSNDRKNSAALFENLGHVTTKIGVPEIIVVGLGPG